MTLHLSNFSNKSATHTNSGSVSCFFKVNSPDAFAYPTTAIGNAHVDTPIKIGHALRFNAIT